METKLRSYQDLIVWRKSLILVKNVYQTTARFPQSEIFGITSQIRRSAISVPSNIAEGYARKTDGELSRFLLIALGSASELETQILISKELKFITEAEFSKINNLTTEVLKLLNSFIRKVKQDRQLAASR